MIKASLVTLGAACLLLLSSWFLEPGWRYTIESWSSIFSLLASLATLTIFLQFYQTYTLWQRSQDDKKRNARAQFTSRMTALASEVIYNIQTCNLLDKEKEEYLSGNTVPNIRFRYDVGNHMLLTGEITHHKLRAALMTLISQMEAMNAVIDQGIQQMILRPSIDPTRLDAIRASSRTHMQYILGRTKLIREQLADTQPFYDEFWKAPEKFNEETYLKDRLIPDITAP